MIRRIATFVIACSGIAAGQCVTASQSAIAAAVAAAPAGGTVNVCAGTTSLTGIAISGKTLIGAGSSTSGTVITSGAITITKNATNLTRVSGFRFTNTGGNQVSVGGSATARMAVVDNNYFALGGTDTNSGLSIGANGVLIFNNTFFMNPSEAGGPDVMAIHPNEDWSQATTFGTSDTQGPVGGERNIYFEDNTFSNILETAPDGDQGARIVIRHNTYNDSSIVFHGGGVGANGNDTSTNPPGTRQYEIYNNAFVRVHNTCGSASNLSKWIWSRGGSGVIANNTFAQLSSAGGCYNGTSIELGIGCQSGVYPVYYQQGQSLAFPVSSPATENPPAKPLLIYGNTGAGAPSACSGTNCSIGGNDSGGGGHTCSSPGTYVQQGRDFFFTTSTTQPTSWSPAWTPLAYPHPVRALLTNQAQSPTFSPVAGTYTTTQTVTISSATTGATICYTTDGSTPTGNGAGTCTHGTTLANGGTVSISVNTTLQAMATVSGFTDSGASSGTYVIQVVAPTFSPVAGTYTSAQSVTLSTTTAGATICYQLNTPPTTNGGGTCNTGSTYNGTPVTVSSTATLYAIGTKANLTDSTTASANYVINIPTSLNITGFAGGSRIGGGSAFTGVNCGPPSYACSNTSTDTINLPLPIPPMGPSSTVNSLQYAAGNQQGANTVIIDNISGARIVRATEGGLGTASNPNHTVPNPYTCGTGLGVTSIPAYRSFPADYSGNSTDQMWNSNSTLLTVARTGGSRYCVIPFNPTTFQVGTPVYSVPFGNISWSHSSPTVLYAIGSSTTVGSPVCTSYCLFKYDFTSSLTAPIVTTIYDFQKAGNCLAAARAITWDGVFTLSSDDTTFMWPANDGYGPNGGQDQGFLAMLYKIGSGCRVLNTGWAYQSITSGTTTGTSNTLTLAGPIPDNMLNGTAVYNGTTIRVSGCSGGTGYNSGSPPESFVVTAVNTGSNTITYTPLTTATGTCTGGTVSMADAGYNGGVIWGDWGTTGQAQIQNASNSTTGTFSNNGIGEGWRLHEGFGTYSGGWFELSGGTCFPANPSGNACSGVDTPFFWNAATATVYAGYISGHFCLSQNLWTNSSNSPLGQFGLLDPATIQSQGTHPATTGVISTSNPNNLAGFQLPDQPSFGAHCSWNNNAGTDTRFFMRDSDSTGFVGTPAINLNLGINATVGTLPAQPFTGPYAAEILGYPTASPGSATALVHRFGHSYSWPGDFNSQFHAAFFVGPISQDGRFASFTSNWMGGLGDDTTGTNSCVLGGPAPVRSTAYPANFVITPTTANTNDYTYQSTGSCTTASSAPTWSPADVTDGSCTWHYVGIRSCRWDTFIMELK